MTHVTQRRPTGRNLGLDDASSSFHPKHERAFLGRWLGLIAGPALVGAVAALVTGLVLGALVIELGIAGTATEGRGALDLGARSTTAGSRSGCSWSRRSSG